MACAGSPTAVTGIGGFSTPPNRARSSTRWAWPVSWYSSSSTAPNRSRSPRTTDGYPLASWAASDIWSAKSSAPSLRLRRWYSSTSGSSASRKCCAAMISVSFCGNAARCPLARGAFSMTEHIHRVYSASFSVETRCSPSSPASWRRSAVAVGADDPVGDEPDHPRGHGFGLPGSGSGDDERGLHRRGDDGGLLGGRPVQTEGIGEFGGLDRVGDDERTHAPTPRRIDDTAG